MRRFEEEELEEELEDLPAAEKEVDPLRAARIRREVNGKTFTGYVEDIEQGKVTHERCFIALKFPSLDSSYASSQKARILLAQKPCVPVRP